MDAVVVWTDTGEKMYRKLRIEYATDIPDGDGDVPRNRSREEFLISLCAVIRFTPELRRVFVVSVIKPIWAKKFIEDTFPQTDVELVLTDYSELLNGMEGFLPCFSSISAVTLLYRIRNLGERFMLFNVGCIPLRMIDTASFESDGRSIFYGRKRRSDALSGTIMEKILIPGHLPVLMRRKAIEECLTDNPGMLARNLRYRFDAPRSRNNPEGQTDLITLLANRPGSLAVDDGDWRRDHGTMVLGLSPCDDKTFLRTIKACDHTAFLDLAPMERFTESQRRAIADYLCHWLQIRLP